MSQHFHKISRGGQIKQVKPTRKFKICRHTTNTQLQEPPDRPAQHLRGNFKTLIREGGGRGGIGVGEGNTGLINVTRGGVMQAYRLQGTSYWK